MVVTDNQEAIAKWLHRQLDSEYVPNKMSCIGYKIHGEYVAATGYESFNGSSVKAHIAIKGFAGKEFFRFIFDYPFNQLKAKKIIAPIISTNIMAINLCKKMGFVVEAVIKDAHPNGDAVFLTITKDQCKMLQTSSNLD